MGVVLRRRDKSVVTNKTLHCIRRDVPHHHTTTITITIITNPP